MTGPKIRITVRPSVPELPVRPPVRGAPTPATVESKPADTEVKAKPEKELTFLQWLKAATPWERYHRGREKWAEWAGKMSRMSESERKEFQQKYFGELERFHRTATDEEQKAYRRALGIPLGLPETQEGVMALAHAEIEAGFLEKLAKTSGKERAELVKGAPKELQKAALEAYPVTPPGGTSKSRVITPTIEIKLPKDLKPDRPGGQTHTLPTGQVVYILGSTMSKMGFHTPEEYRNAQRYGLAYGPHKGELVPENSIIIDHRLRDTKTRKYKTIRLRYSNEPGIMAPTLRAHVKINNYKVEVETYRGTRLLHIKDIQAFTRLKGRAQFKKAMALGLIPRGSEYVAAITKEDIARIEAAIKATKIRGAPPVEKPDLKPRDWVYLTAKQIKEREKSLKDSAARAKELIKIGRERAAFKKALGSVPEQYRTADGIDLVDYLSSQPRNTRALRDIGYTDEQIREAQKFIDTHVRPGAGSQWLSKDNYNNLPHRLQAAYDKKGWSGVESLLGIVAKDLKPYRTYVTPEEGHPRHKVAVYDVPKFLRENPQDEWKLRIHGFSDEAIKQAKEYNAQPWVKESPMEAWWKKVVSQGGQGLSPADFQQFLLKHPDLMEEGLKMMRTPGPKTKQRPTMSLDQFTAEFMAARGIKPIGLTGIPTTWEQKDAKDLAMAQYERVYGTKSAAASFGQATASILFAPARVMYPEVTFKDIKAIEWGLGGAQVVLLALPAVIGPLNAVGGVTLGKIVTTTATIGAGTVFTVATVQNWEHMSNVERAIAVILDTIILGSGLAGAIPRVAPRVTKLTGKVIDASAKTIGKIKTTRVKPTKGQAAIARDMGRAGHLLTEGGKVGPWCSISDTALVRAVAAGKKPLGLIEDVVGGNLAALKLARRLGLKIRYGGGFRLRKGDIVNRLIGDGAGHTRIVSFRIRKPSQSRCYWIFRDNPTGHLAYRRIQGLKRINPNTSNPHDFIRYHTDLGKALGYRPQDIRAYLNHSANLDIAYGQGFALKRALEDLSWAIRTNDEWLLKSAARRLQIIAAKIPPQLGGGELARRARLLLANPKAYLRLGRGKVAAIEAAQVEQSIKANKEFIKLLERQLRKVKNIRRKEELEKALREAQGQVKKTAVQTKTKTPFIRTMSPEEASKYLPVPFKTPAKVPKKVPVPATKPVPVSKPEIRAGEGSRVSVAPDEKFYTKPSRKLAPQRIPREMIDPRPGVIPSPKPAPLPSQKPKPEEKPEEKLKLKLKEKLKEKPEEKPKPKPAPFPTPTPTPTPGPKAEPEPRPKPEEKPKPKPKPKPEEKPEEKPKKRIRLKLPKKGTPATPETYPKGTIALQQGIVYMLIKPPYKAESDIAFSKEKPAGVKLVADSKSAYKTIQMITGKPPSKAVKVQLGFSGITITKPGPEPGRQGAITFTRGTIDGIKVGGQRSGGNGSRPGHSGGGSASVKKGKIFHTRMPGGSVMSRRPIKRRKVLV